MTSIYLVDNGGIGLSNNSGETVVHPPVYYGGAFTKNIYKYIYNGSYAIAIGTSTILKSSNPTSSGSWSEQSQSVLAPYTYINANTSGEEFCILGWNGEYWLTITSAGKVLKSTDGTIWNLIGNTNSSLRPGDHSTRNKSNLLWTGTFWIYASSSSSTHCFFKSEDGVTWTGLSNNTLLSATSIVYNGSYYIAFGTRNPSGLNSEIVKSTDCITWTAATITGVTFTSEMVAWNGSYWLGVGYHSEGRGVIKSTDGTNWVSPTNVNLRNCIAWDGTNWISLHNDMTTIYRSSDGSNWTAGDQYGLRTYLIVNPTTQPILSFGSPPEAPTGVTAVAGNGQVTVSWSAPASNGSSAITGYTVTPSSGSAVTVGNVLTTTITGLTNGTPLTFTVVAINSTGTSSASSASSSVTPVAAVSAPGAPTGVTAVAGNGQVTVSWSAPASNGGSAITAYTVTPSSGSAVTVGNVLTTTITGLANGTPITFTVVATNSAGTSSASSASSSVTPVAAPGAPTGVTVSAGVNSVTISWSAPANTGGSAITGYIVTPSSGSIVTVGNVLTTTITGLAAGTSLTFTVSASNTAGNSAASAASASVTPRGPGLSVPSAVIGVTGVAGPASATISWSAPVSDGGSAITGYKLICDPDNKGGVLNLAGPTARSLTIAKGIKNAVPTTYSVVAINAVGQSDSIKLISYPLPGAPKIASALRGASGVINLVWTAKPGHVASPITGYLVAVASTSPSPAPGTMVIPTPTVTATGGSVSISGLTNGSSYIFSVKSVSDIGQSLALGLSKPTIAATTPSVPTSFTGTKAVASAILNWVAPTNTGGLPIIGYNISYTLAGVAKIVLIKAPAITGIIKGLVNGTAYSFTIQSITLAGASPQSAAVTVTPGLGA